MTKTAFQTPETQLELSTYTVAIGKRNEFANMFMELTANRPISGNTFSLTKLRSQAPSKATATISKFSSTLRNPFDNSKLEVAVNLTLRF